MRSWSVLLVLFVGVAHADPAPPITIKSVVASSGGDDVWKLFASNGTWCPRAATDTLTIKLAKPTALARIELAHEWTITGVTVVADGVSHAGVPDKATGGMEKARRTTPIAIGGAPVTTLVVTATGTGCISDIRLPTVAVYGSDASTLWDDVAAIKTALTSCQPKALAQAFRFPFSVGWYTTTNDGLKDHSIKFTTASKLETGCKQNTTLHNYRDAMTKESPTIHSSSATQLDLQAGDGTWTLGFIDGHWRAISVMMGG